MEDHITNIEYLAPALLQRCQVTFPRLHLTFAASERLSRSCGLLQRDIAPQHFAAQGFPTRRLFELKIIERSDVISALYASY